MSNMAESAAWPEADAAMAVVERLLAISPHGEDSDAALRLALEALFALRQSRLEQGDHLTKLTQATTCLRAAADALQRNGKNAELLEDWLTGLQQARSAVVEQLVLLDAGKLGGRRVAGDPAGGPPARRMQLSRGEPALHRLSLPLRPSEVVAQTDDRSVALDDTPPPLTTAELFAELRTLLDDQDPAAASRWQQSRLDEDSPPQPAGISDARSVQRAPLPPGGAHAELQALARSCLETIATTGMLRQLGANDRWGHATARFETRLLTALDALVALGEPVPGCTVSLDVGKETQAYAAQAFTDDPFRSFAAAFVVGCLDDPAAARIALLQLRGAGPSAQEAAVHALALASNAGVEDAARALVRDECDPLLLAAGLRLLRLRAARTVPEAWLLLQHVDVHVRQASAHYLAEADRRPADCPRLQQALAREHAPGVQAALFQALVRADRAVGVEAVREALQDERARPRSMAPGLRSALTLLLALAGKAADTALLMALAERWPDACEALGWHGMTDSVQPLLALLEGAPQRDPGFGEAAAAALHRITGASPMTPADRGEGAIGALASHWRHYWAQHGSALRPGQRYRLGQPYHPRSAHAELLLPEVPMGVRRTLALELSLQTDAPIFPVHSWHAAQLRLLAGFASRSTGRRANPGSPG